MASAASATDLLRHHWCVDLEERQLAILRYLRDHAVATAATIAHEVLGAPRSTFGRTLRTGAAQELLSALAEAGLVVQGEHGRHAEFTLTQAGRRALRDSSLGA